MCIPQTILVNRTSFRPPSYSNLPLTIHFTYHYIRNICCTHTWCVNIINWQYYIIGKKFIFEWWSISNFMDDWLPIDYVDCYPYLARGCVYYYLFFITFVRMIGRRRWFGVPFVKYWRECISSRNRRLVTKSNCLYSTSICLFFLMMMMFALSCFVISRNSMTIISIVSTKWIEWIIIIIICGW